MKRSDLESRLLSKDQVDEHPRLQQMCDNLLRIQSSVTKLRHRETSRPLKILAVDSDRNFLINLKNFLLLHQFKVITVVDGLSALSLFQNQRFDLAITGPEMSKQGEHSVAHYIKSAPQPIPIISVTDSREIERNYFDAVLELPLQPTKLLKEISCLSPQPLTNQSI